jgi:SAM-dependent methyltransferase
MSTDPGAESTDRLPYRDVLRQKLLHRSVASGKITIPAAPGMLDEYVALCANIFEDIGRPFSDDDLAGLRKVLEGQLAAAFEASQRSQIVITYEAPIGGVVNYHVKAEWFSVQGAYDNWVATRKPPLFGTHPDARVMALVKEVADPTAHPVLDIGAGTGRNALALARLGHLVDAVEMAPKFADILRAEAEKESLNVRVLQRDLFATADDLRRDYGLILLSEVVSDFRTPEELRRMFEIAAECLGGGGKLVFNAFLGRMGYVPDEGVRQFAQQCYTGIFTTQELGDAVSGLPLQLLSDDSVYRYEKAHLPHGAWPPTSWYADWVSGRDVFAVPREESPIELRWLVYQKPSW